MSLLSSQSGLGALSERTSSRGSSRSANVLQSLFNPFVRSQDKTDQLNDFLTTYTLVSLPHLPDSITRGRLKFNPNSLYMENHWTDIVAGHEKFNKRERDQQEVIWEMLTTEVEYIRKLRVIIDLFYSCLIHLQSNQLLTEIEIDKVFSNIYEVFNATNHFWSCHMIQLLKDSRQKREQLNFCLLKSGFGIFDTIFKPYIEYCLDQEKCRDYLKVKMKENELFRTFITWAESQPQCSRLTLNDLISKPFQRITRYALLLGALKKTLEKMERNADVKQKIEDITKMMEQVDSFVVKVNGVMRQRQEHIQLSTMMSRIDSYDVVEAPSDECSSIVSQHCKLDLTMPVPGCGHHVTRKILFEGSLKLKDTYNKMDVYCFLFTDMLLITKPSTRRGDKVKVIKPPMRLDKIVVQSMRDVASFMMMHLNEYSMAQSVYTFHGDSKNWVDHLRKAKKDYQTIRSDFSLRNSGCTDILATDQPSKAILIPDKRLSSDSTQDRATQESSQTHHQKRKPSSSSTSTSTDLLADDHSICKSSASFPLAGQISQLSVPTSSSSINRSNSEHHRVNPDMASSSHAHVTNVDRRGTSSDRLRRKFKLRQISGGSLNESSDEYDLVAANVEVRPTPPKTTILELCSSTPYLPVDVKSMDNTDVSNSNVSISTLVTPSIQVRRPSCQHRKSISEPLKHFLTETTSLSASGSSEYIDSPDGDYKQWLASSNVVTDKNIKCLSSSMHDLNSIPPTIINSNLSGSTSRLYDKIKTDSVDTISLDGRSIDISESLDPPGDSSLSHVAPMHGTLPQLNNSSTEKQQSTVNTKNATCNIKDDEGIAIEIDDTNLEDDPIGPGDGPAMSKKESTSSVEEFHLCCLPEDYFYIPSSNSSVISSNNNQEPLSSTWKKHRHHQILSVTEVSTQTPIEFLISGYFSIVTPIDLDYSQRSTTHSRSLPDIFDVLAVNYLKNGNTDLYKCPTNTLLNSRALQAK